MPTQNPVWREIAADLRQRIDAGEWAPGETLPPMRELAGNYRSATHAPVNRAILHLISEGILLTDPSAPRRGVRVRARPSVVRDLLIGTPLARSSTPGRTFEEQTATTDVDVHVDYEIGTAPAEIAALLGLADAGQVLQRTFTYRIQGTPHQVMTSYMSTDVAEAAGLCSPEDEIPGKTTATWLSEAGIKVERARFVLNARVPTLDEVERLALPNGHIPIIVRQNTLYAAGPVAVEASTVLVVADQVTYVMDIDMRESGC